MQALHMITVCENYQPLAGTCANTIRRYAGKYQGLSVDDNVIMHYTNDPNTTGPVIATEFLKVSSIAVASLDTIIEYHKYQNQGWKNDFDLKALILSLYPVADGQERNPDELYCAIYF